MRRQQEHTQHKQHQPRPQSRARSQPELCLLTAPLCPLETLPTPLAHPPSSFASPPPPPPSVLPPRHAPRLLTAAPPPRLLRPFPLPFSSPDAPLPGQHPRPFVRPSMLSCPPLSPVPSRRLLGLPLLRLWRSSRPLPAQSLGSPLPPSRLPPVSSETPRPSIRLSTTWYLHALLWQAQQLVPWLPPLERAALPRLSPPSTQLVAPCQLR